ncbi:MAG: site-2 protease family protein [Phycisphaerales bacterium]|nr:site-2 protease family protein [Phycisphaerales bacterium]
MLGSNWWVTGALESGGPIWLFSWIFWVICSITLHELAHGWAALRRGDTTPIDTGHMTWNPIVHMGPTSLIMFALLGLAWGAMPIDPTRMRGRFAEAFVAVAGPVMNLLLAAACILVLGPWIVFGEGEIPEPALSNFRKFLIAGAGLNIVLAVFNMLPVPPLDGSRVLANFYRPYERFIDSEQGRIMSLVAFVLVFMFSGGIIFEIGFSGALAITTEYVLLLRSF